MMEKVSWVLVDPAKGVNEEVAAEIIGENAIGMDAGALSEIESETRSFMASPDAAHSWTQLSIFAPVRAIKSRHDCVYLPFTAINKAISDVTENS